jgi:hypothetical protein
MDGGGLFGIRSRLGLRDHGGGGGGGGGSWRKLVVLIAVFLSELQVQASPRQWKLEAQIEARTNIDTCSLTIA